MNARKTDHILEMPGLEEFIIIVSRMKKKQIDA